MIEVDHFPHRVTLLPSFDPFESNFHWPKHYTVDELFGLCFVNQIQWLDEQGLVNWKDYTRALLPNSASSATQGLWHFKEKQPAMLFKLTWG